MNAVIATARRGHSGLFWFAAVMAATSVVLVGLAAVDHRELLGAPLWFKPLKFTLSFTLYSGTLAWMLGQLREPALRRSGWVVTIASAVEMVVIIGQAARGVRSHFNDDDLFGRLLFDLMGVSVVVLYLGTIAIALRFLREPGRDRASGLAIRLGLGVGLVGLGVGFLMIANGGHAVGVADGGPGLALLGWSTTGGDLRISHFVGMHALQFLPLLAAGLAAAGTRFTEAARVRIVIAAAGGYVALLALLTWQALRGQPLLAPDGLTLAVLAAIVLGTGAAVVAAVVMAVRTPARIPV